MDLYKNGINLYSNLDKFLKEINEYNVFVPYIKDAKFRELLSINSNCKQVVVRWLPIDLVTGASDLSIFDTCSEYGITLYRNPRLHLKTFSNMTICFMGSANISAKAISKDGEKNYNYELATLINHIDFETKVYFQSILLDSTLVDESYIENLKEQIRKIKLETSPEDFDFKMKKDIKDPFLLSALPMTSSIDILVDIYLGNNNYSEEEMSSAAHDIALYSIPMNLQKDEMLRLLKYSFNSHPFVKSIKEHIGNQPSKSLRYGGVVKWIQQNTTTVPTPKSWELKEKQIVNILYEWICEFDSSFRWDQPNHSQIIYKI